VITDPEAPFQAPGSGTVVLFGSLCPDGAVLKISAASPHLLKHRGQALVFDRVEDYNAVCDNPDLPVDESTVLVVRNAGPKGYPGFPEVGNMAVPKVLLDAGVSDMVRVSDARMSGTGFGTCVLHVAPEAAVGGPLALVRTGDWIELDVSARRLDLIVDDAELQRRRTELTDTRAQAERGYVKLYVEHVLQANQGADFDFLRGASGWAAARHSH
jgi:dihydroxy-acid dehydratase